MPPSGDAISPRPSLAEEMGRFQTFSTKDNEPLDPANEDLADAGGKNISEDEKKAGVVIVGDDKTKTKTAAPAVKVPAGAAQKAAKLTDEESEAAITALDKALGREATPDEITAALKKAQKDKPNPEISKQTVRDRLHVALKEKERERQRARSAEGSVRAAHARAAAAERERDDLRARMAQGDTRGLTGDTKKANDEADAAPDPKKFEFGELDAGYIRALTRWETRQEIAEHTKKQDEKRQTASQREADAKFEESKAAFEEAGADKYEDFEEVVMQGARDKAWPLSNSLGELLFDSEYGPDIAYELASDTKLAKEIFGKSALQQAAWLGRQEARLSAGTGATESDDEEEVSEDTEAAKITNRKVSKAPAPVTRARGQGSNSSVPGDTQDFRAFESSIMGQAKR